MSRVWAVSGLLGVTFLWFHGFGLPFFTAKWIWFYVLGVFAAAGFLIRPGTLAFPQGAIVWAIAAVLFYVNFLLNTVRLVPAGAESFLADRMGFAFVALFSFSAFARHHLRWDDLWPAALIGIWGVSALGLMQFFSLGFSGQNMPYYQASSTLGHTNNAGQWLGVLMLMVIAGMPHAGKAKMIGWGGLLLALVYLIFARSRSVWIGMALSGGWLVYLRYRPVPWKKVALALGIVYVLVVGVQVSRGTPWSGAVTLQLLEQKSSMVLWRWNVWKATMGMIQAHPTGVGTDQFEFKAQPFIREFGMQNPDFLAFSPHNEWLRFPAEEGVGGALILLVAVIAWCWPYFRRHRNDSNFALISATGLLLLTESVFQFPFQNAPVAFFWALWLGYVGAKGMPHQFVPKGLAWIVVVPLFLGLTWNGSRVAYSRFVEGSGNYELLVRACDWFPANWRACNTKGKIEYERKDYAAARATLSKMLEIAPLNYQALQNMGAVAIAEGNKLEGCFYWWRYKDLFRERTPKEHMDRYEGVCEEKWRRYFEFRRPEKFLGRQL